MSPQTWSLFYTQPHPHLPARQADAQLGRTVGIASCRLSLIYSSKVRVRSPFFLPCSASDSGTTLESLIFFLGPSIRYVDSGPT